MVTVFEVGKRVRRTKPRKGTVKITGELPETALLSEYEITSALLPPELYDSFEIDGFGVDLPEMKPKETSYFGSRVNFMRVGQKRIKQLEKKHSHQFATVQFWPKKDGDPNSVESCVLPMGVAEEFETKYSWPEQLQMLHQWNVEKHWPIPRGMLYVFM